MNWWNTIFPKRKFKQAFIEEYYNKFDDKLHSKTPINQVRFVVLDTETTGLNPRHDYVLSIGAFAVQNGSIKIHDSFEQFLKPERILKNENITIHEITQAAQKNSLPASKVFEDFTHFIGNSILVGHHISFDYSILNHNAKRLFDYRFVNKTIDTLALAMRIEQPNKSPDLIKNSDYSLDALCERYNIEPVGRHTATGDAYSTALLFIKLLKLAEKRNITTLGELLKT